MGRCGCVLSCRRGGGEVESRAVEVAEKGGEEKGGEEKGGEERGGEEKGGEEKGGEQGEAAAVDVGAQC